MESTARGIRPLRLALIGNFRPQRCGIAEFTSDLHDSVVGAGLVCDVFAMCDGDALPAERADVRGFIRRGVRADYRAAAEAINQGKYDLVCVQHEYGIFGGEAGAFLLDLVEVVRAPVVATLHTVLTRPSPAESRVLDRLVRRSAKVVVMAEMGRSILCAHGIQAGKICVIPHGTPDRAPLNQNLAKRALRVEDRFVILTFGLLSPNKGIEAVIRALPSVVVLRPDVLYVVAGVTHPNLVEREGEAYRESLIALAQDLDVGASVLFIDEYVDDEKLWTLLSAADLYATPYLNEAQVTSGALSYAVGLGKAVVSTPYWHAAELLADGRGVLAPFGDWKAFGAAIRRLVEDCALRARVGERARAAGRETAWGRVGQRYAALFQEAASREIVLPRKTLAAATPASARAASSLRGVEMFTDACGIFQHGAFSVPDRVHGYCLDDNARALLLMNRLQGQGFARDHLERLATIYAAFVNHAWDRDAGCFRNFMSFDRRWLEPEGSPDSAGRALWALGDTVRRGVSEGLRRWSLARSQEAFARLPLSPPPRTRAFAALGLAELVEAMPEDERWRAMLDETARPLHEALRAERRQGRAWFEPFLSYDNARLAQALIAAGVALGDDGMIEDGVCALGWLCEIHTAPSGVFRPVGSDRLAVAPSQVAPFDQQPLEAAAAIDACLVAFNATGEARWIEEAQRAFSWFLGENDLGAPVVRTEEGLCHDGLCANGVNLNHGAESILAYQMSVAAMRVCEGAKARRTLIAHAPAAPPVAPAAANDRRPEAAGF